MTSPAVRAATLVAQLYDHEIDDVTGARLLGALIAEIYVWGAERERDHLLDPRRVAHALWALDQARYSFPPSVGSSLMERTDALIANLVSEHPLDKEAAHG